MEPSEKVRELVRKHGMAAVEIGRSESMDDKIRVSERTAETYKRLLDYIAPMERDHRAMERLRETGMHWRFVQGGLRSSLKSEVGPAPGHYTDPADAILGRTMTDLTDRQDGEREARMGDEVIEAMDRVIEEELTHPPHTVDARQVLRAALEATDPTDEPWSRWHELVRAAGDEHD